MGNNIKTAIDFLCDCKEKGKSINITFTIGSDSDNSEIQLYCENITDFYLTTNEKGEKNFPLNFYHNKNLYTVTPS